MKRNHLLAPVCALVLAALPVLAMAGETAGPAVSAETANWAFIGAALSVGCSTIGAGIAIAMVGSAAMGAISERPEILGRALIFLGLAEGIAIYGLIVAIMILGKI
ncbi:MAG TPA: F0F1 ATP synthase subunit C [Desulfobulbus sp.]|nr:F0F1 ATP synthase subunit C [Desulfobulbus sp.]